MKMLKKILLCAIFVSISSVMSAQMNWKEKDAYHKVMSQTFHPAEEGNFQPIKARSGELVAAAEVWRKSTIPSDVPNPKELKKTLNKLCKDSKKLDKKVKANATDVELKDDLFALHDTFHTIVGLCKTNDDHGDHGSH